MTYAARRLLAPITTIAQSEGVPVELLGIPTTEAARIPTEVLFDAADRLELALGGSEALVEAATSREVWAGTSVLTREARSPYLVAHKLFTTVLPDDMADLRITWQDVGPDAFLVRVDMISTPGLSRGFGSLLTGLLRSAPLFFEATPAHVVPRHQAGVHEMAVTFPPRESLTSSSVSAALGRSDTVNAVLAMLEDRALYREQRDNTQRTAAMLAEGFAKEGSSEDAADHTLRVLMTQLSLGHGLLWAGPTPRERRLLASIGERKAAGRVLLLDTSHGSIGMLELESTHDAGFVEALLPWIAGEIDHRLARERTAPVQAPVAPARWGLSPRQASVCSLLLSGLANKEIALALGCSPGTVEDHLTAIYRKAGVSGRGALLVAAADRHEPSSPDPDSNR